MAKLLRLHKKYGVNPTIAKCFLCGEAKNEIALLGSAFPEEAPMYMVLDVEPCEKCREKYLKIGVLLAEAERRENHFGKIDYYPNGKFLVIKDEAFKKVFNREIPPRKIVFVEIGLLDKISEK